MDNLFDYLIHFSINPDLCPLHWNVRQMVENVLLTSLVNDDDVSEISLESISEEQMACLKNISNPYVTDFTTEIMSNIQRFLLDYKVYVRSLQLANKIITTVKLHRFSSSCMIALTKMKHCAYCGGFAKFRPCLNLCLNTIQGCMADVFELHEDFKNFVASFQTLSREIDFDSDSLVTNQLQRFSTMIPEFRQQSSLEYLVSHCYQPLHTFVTTAVLHCTYISLVPRPIFSDITGGRKIGLGNIVSRCGFRFNEFQ